MAAEKPAPPYGQLEWEPLKPAVRRRVHACYEHAQKLTQAKGKIDHDYAHDMLAQCVKGDPGNMVYIEAMLDNLQKKHNNNKKGGGAGGGDRGAFKKAVKENDWAEILKLGPELLKSNPWDTSTLRPMADACGCFGFNEAELRYLKNALDANLKDESVNIHCAKTLARVGQFDQAIACWRRIGERRGKGDTEVDNMISDLTLRKTQVLTGLGDDDKATGRVVNENLAGKKVEKEIKATIGVEANKADEKKKIELTPRQKMERAIADNPDDLDNYPPLAELHQKEGRLSDAVDVWKKALAASGGDFRIQEKLEDAEVLQMRQQLAVAEKRAATKDDDHSKQLAAQMREQYHRREFEICSSRSERHPENIQLKFELGVRLKRIGNFEQAEKTLMEVRKHPKFKAAATFEVGECLQQQQKYSNALQFYARAVELLSEKGSDVELQKLALYRAGNLATGLKQYEPAEKFYFSLSKVDARYKDVLSRLDKVKKLRHKG